MASSIEIKRIQKWLARSSVGASTVRGQTKLQKYDKIKGNVIKEGDNPGLVNTITEYLGEEIDFNQIKSINDEEKYKKFLKDRTYELRNKLEKEIANKRDPKRFWGISRKCLNIFLIKVYHDKYLSKKYELENLGKYLELPLDGPHMRRLHNTRALKNLTTTIKELDQRTSDKYQNIANQLAGEKGIVMRYQLDFDWREAE